MIIRTAIPDSDDIPKGNVGDRWDMPPDWADMGDGVAGRFYLRADQQWWRDQRKDEDPRHDFCDRDDDHGISFCHRCDTSYGVLLARWMEEQTPGWAYGDKNWSEIDPKRRSLEQGRYDFENSLCEGERRNAAGRWIP